MNYFSKLIASILMIALNNCSWAAMLSCRLEGVSFNDGPIRQHPTGERVTINVSPSIATLWSNQEYVRLPKLDKTLPSGNIMHMYGKKSELANGIGDGVAVTYEQGTNSIFIMTINNMPDKSEMRVYGRCLKNN